MSAALRAELTRAAEAGGPAGRLAAEALSDGPQHRRLAAAIRALAAYRGPSSSTCPSDAARAVGGEGWRDLMPMARDLARELARAGHVTITQRGAALDPDEPWRGPVRIRTRQPELPPTWAS
jgi:hypothetical protein